MNFIEMILLSIVQALTEFFPVSSSGHLMISKMLFDLNQYDMLVDVMLHLGTLLSILYFWKSKIKNEFVNFNQVNNNLFKKIIVGSLPAVFVGFIFKEQIIKIFNIQEAHESFPVFLIINYFIMSIVIFFTKYYFNNKKKHITFSHAFIIGLAQAIAILPGISRSGLTIALGLFLGYKFSSSLKFSFFLAIPILLFAGISSLIDNYSLLIIDYKFVSLLSFGITSSAIFGYYILRLLNIIIIENRYWYFSIYNFVIFLILFLFNYGY